MQTKLRVRQALTAVAALGFATTLSVVVRGDGLKGAIFTTNIDGTIVNQNQYAAKTDVYLDGGPGPHAPLTAASLPDGIYVFQVTDPSGKALLSSDAASYRQFTVLGGRITSVYNHNTGNDLNDGGYTVQLYPFLDTPNPGGVYKAWVTPLDVYLGRVGNAGLIAVPKAATCITKTGSPSKCTGGTTATTYAPDPGFGPPRNQQKTDNFKIKDLVRPVIDVTKYEDTNGNGFYDSDDKEKIGWPISISDPIDGKSPDTTVTNRYFTPKHHVQGDFGYVLVCEDFVEHWTFEKVYVNGVETTPEPNTGTEVCVKVDNTTNQSVRFLNFNDVTLKGCKTDEYNAVVAGYPIIFQNGSVETLPTGDDGCVTVYRGPLPGGFYTIAEGTLPEFFPLQATPCTTETDPSPRSGKEYDCSFQNQRSRIGRFTGGGSTSSLDLDNGRVRVTQGMELHCRTTDLPNNLEVNWGPGNRFHLDALTGVGCFDDPAIIPTPPDANFDTIIGTGTGKCNGVAGATIAFTMKDAGEPGTEDSASLAITCPAGSGVSGLTVSGTGSKVNKGNLQAHY